MSSFETTHQIIVTNVKSLPICYSFSLPLYESDVEIEFLVSNTIVIWYVNDNTNNLWLFFSRWRCQWEKGWIEFKLISYMNRMNKKFTIFFRCSAYLFSQSSFFECESRLQNAVLIAENRLFSCGKNKIFLFFNKPANSIQN